MSSRVLKSPAVRKQEILDTAMALFHEKGYDATSIADIAKAMNVVPGLCYRYFSNKKEIFDEAVKQYAVVSCQDYLEVVNDHSRTFKEKINLLGHLISNKKHNREGPNICHEWGNETFHFQLSIEMSKYLAPYISKELSRLHKIGEIKVDNPDIMTDFLLYGQIALWLFPGRDTYTIDFQSRLLQIKKYIYKLFDVTE